MEKLYELHEERRLRPHRRRHAAHPQRARLPRRARRRLTRFLDHRLYKLLTVAEPRRAQGGEHGGAVVRPLDRQGGRRRRHRRRHRLLPGLRRHGAGLQGPGHPGRGAAAGRRDAFVLVASPRRDTIDEATFFAEKLAEAGIPVGRLVVNRMHPRFDDGLAEATRERADRSTARPSATSTATWPTSSWWRHARTRTWPASPRRSRRRRSCGCRSCAPTCTTSTASAEIQAHLVRPDDRPVPVTADEQALAARPRHLRPGPSAASSTDSATGTMRSKPVVWSRRVSDWRLQATATSPPPSRVRRMPPMSAPRPAESMNGTSDRSISSGVDVGDAAERLSELADGVGVELAARSAERVVGRSVDLDLHRPAR